MPQFPKREKGWLRFHRRLLDGGLAPYFHPHFAKLKNLYDAGVRQYHKWSFGDFWSAETRIQNEDLSVTLRPRDRLYFEFFTTGKPIEAGVTMGGTSSVKAACVGVDVALEEAAIRLLPQIRTGARNFDGRKISLVERPYQVQLINEPSSTPVAKLQVLGRNKFYKTLYESWAPMHSHTGAGINAFTWGFQGYNPGKATVQLIPTRLEYPGAEPPVNSYNMRDVGFDVPYEDGLRADPIRFGLLNDGTVDWPRATGVITVKDDVFGSREFAIYIDTSNQFSVFPTSQIGPENGTVQNVDPDFVKTATPVFPAWVWLPSARFIDLGEVFDVTQPEYDWKVSPDGKNACAVVYERVAATFDTAYFNYTGALGPRTTLDSADFDTVCRGVDGRQGQDTSGAPQYFYGPGLVEATIKIVLTGDHPEDFTLDVTIEELRRPTTTPFCTLLAGYVHHDIKDMADRGDLITVDIERYYRSSPQMNFIKSHLNKGVMVTRYGEYDTDMVHGGRFFVPASYPPAGVTVDSVSVPPWPDDGPPYSSPYYTDTVIVAAQTVTWDSRKDYPADDTRRTLYSVYNLTQDVELNTFPGWPSGIYREQDNLFARFHNETFYTVPRTLNHFGGGVGSDGETGSAIRFLEAIPYEFYLEYGGDPASPFGSGVLPFLYDTNQSYFQSQIVDFDLATLSFVLKFSTYEGPQWPLIKVGEAGNFGRTHISYAVYTFGELREQFFPDSMTDANVDLHTSLVAEMEAVGGFRDQYVAGDDWIFMPLNDTQLNDWAASEFDQSITDTHRSNGVAIMIKSSKRVRADWGSSQDAGPSAAYVTGSAALRQWWLALFVYNRIDKLFCVSNPKPLWNMYQELTNNALHRSPWSTFYVHAGGSWMLFDQACIYNKEGTFGQDSAQLWQYGQNFVPVTFNTVWDGLEMSNFEHFIVDRVHLAFELAGDVKLKKDTTFVKLYNEARKNLPDDKLADFDEIDYDSMRADFTKADDSGTDGLGPFFSYSINVSWYGYIPHTWKVGFYATSDRVDDNFNANGHKWRVMNLGGGVGSTSPQDYTYHITFSSPLIIQY